MTLEEVKQLIIQVVSLHEAEAFVVGGMVRDELLELDISQSKDLDVLIVGMSLVQVISSFSEHGKVDAVGQSFGVVKFRPFGWKEEDIDISIPRIEVSTGDGHKDFDVVTHGVTLEQDQERRDFTINAIMKNLKTNEFIDFKGIGLDDLKDKVIRMTSEDSMREDPLRMLRAIQFASRFDFKIEHETFIAISRNAHMIDTVAKERVLIELEKLFMKSKNPSIGLRLLEKVGLRRHILPEQLNTEQLKMINMAKKNMNILMFFLMERVENPLKEMKKLKVDNKTSIEVIQALNFWNTDFTDDDIKLFNNQLKGGDDTLELIDEVCRLNRLNFRITKRLHEMRTAGIPTCFKELPINGDDLMKRGFKGKEIREELENMLLKGSTSDKIIDNFDLITWDLVKDPEDNCRIKE
jgi:tRNA nucleotidyltransferase (CCA-adding enzyme)